MGQTKPGTDACTVCVAVAGSVTLDSTCLFVSESPEILSISADVFDASCIPPGRNCSGTKG